MKPMKLKINGAELEVDAPDDMPLLWVLRDAVGLTGTKYGCGEALCGACTIHVDGKAVRSCVVAARDIGDAEITTIEGLSKLGDHPLQKAWLKHGVPQCGFCQAGQIMGAAALLAKNPAPSDAEIEASMAGHLCRCGTYTRIREAIKDAARGRP